MKNSTAVWCISFFILGFGTTGSILTGDPVYDPIILLGVAGLIAYFMTKAVEDTGEKR